LQVLGRDKVREGKEGTLKCLVLSCLVVVVAAAVVCVVVVVMLLLRVVVACCCCLVVVAAALRLDLLGNFFEDRLYTQLKHRAVHRQSVRIGAIIIRVVRILRFIRKYRRWSVPFWDETCVAAAILEATSSLHFTDLGMVP
jgi:hypothetical protein